MLRTVLLEKNLQKILRTVLLKKELTEKCYAHGYPVVGSLSTLYNIFTHGYRISLRPNGYLAGAALSYN